MRTIVIAAVLGMLGIGCTAQRHCVDPVDQTEREWSSVEHLDSREKSADCGRWISQ